MAADRAAAGALAADIAPQQQQVDQRADGVRSVNVLRQAHAIDADHGPRPGIDRADPLHRRAAQAADLLKVGPAGRIDPVHPALKTMRVGVQEIMVQHAPAAAVQFQHMLGDAGQRGDVAARPHLQITVGDFGGRAHGHLPRALRVGEFQQAIFAQGVDRHDAAATLGRLLQRMQHAGAVRAGVLADLQDHVAMLEILQHAGADRRSDDGLQPDGRRLMAHVRTVGQVHMAIGAGIQAVQERRLQPCLTRCVESHGLGVHRLQLLPDLGKGRVPSGFQITVAGRVIAQRVGQTARHLQVVLRPGGQFRHRMVQKEIRPTAFRGQVPQGGLGTVFAEFDDMRVGRLAPRAGRTHQPAGLVLTPQRVQRTGAGFGGARHLGHALSRSPSPDGAVIGKNAVVGLGLVVGHVGLLSGGRGRRTAPASDHAAGANGSGRSASSLSGVIGKSCRRTPQAL